jgi:hypothetical protein
MSADGSVATKKAVTVGDVVPGTYYQLTTSGGGANLTILFSVGALPRAELAYASGSTYLTLNNATSGMSVRLYDAGTIDIGSPNFAGNGTISVGAGAVTINGSLTGNGSTWSLASTAGANGTLQSTSHAAKGTVTIHGSKAILRGSASRAVDLVRDSDGAVLGWVKDGGQGAGAGLGFVSQGHAEFSTPAGYALFLNRVIFNAIHSSQFITINMWPGGGDAFGVYHPGTSQSYFRVTGSGHTIFHNNAAPDSAVLANGALGLWVDSTNGASAAKLVWKEANGTVRTKTLAFDP